MGVLLSKRSSFFKGHSHVGSQKKLAAVSPSDAKSPKLDIVPSASSQDLKYEDERSEVTVQAIPINNGLQIPIFETNIRIMAVSNKTGLKSPVPIVPSSDPKKFFALFEEDNADFEIQIDNLGSPKREVGIRLSVHRLKKKFIIERSRVGNLRTFESNGKKFHFIRQSSEDGQIFVGTFANQNDISFQDASIIVSQLKFSVEYSKPSVIEDTRSDLIKIKVMEMHGQLSEVLLSQKDSIGDLKRKLQGLLGISEGDQKLIFGGKILEDKKSLEDYKIQENSTVYVVEKVKGGGASLVPFLRDYVKDFDLSNHEVIPYEFGHEVGEIGAVAFGEKSDQRFCSTSFDADENIHVNDFIIELRTKSKYAFAN